MCAWSMKCAAGRMTAALARLAVFDPCIFNTALKAGWLVLFVPPLSRSESSGLKPRARQSEAWKYWLRGAEAPRVEVAVPRIDYGSQLVGLRVKSGLDTLIAISRTSSGRPW